MRNTVAHDNLLHANNFSCETRVIKSTFNLAIYHTFLKFKFYHSYSNQLQPPTYEHEEAVLDCLLSFLRAPTFLRDIFFNFDCDLLSEDLVERLLEFLQPPDIAGDQVMKTLFLLLLFLL